MMAAEYITPNESCENEEILNCVRVFLQEQKRKCQHILKAEATVPGDFEDCFVQPVAMTERGAHCKYEAVTEESPFRISNVFGNENNHTQGIVLSTFILHKLNKDTLGAMQKVKYDLPVARSPPPLRVPLEEVVMVAAAVVMAAAVMTAAAVAVRMEEGVVEVEATEPAVGLVCLSGGMMTQLEWFLICRLTGTGGRLPRKLGSTRPCQNFGAGLVASPS